MNLTLMETPLYRKHWARYNTGSMGKRELQGLCPEDPYSLTSVMFSVCNDYRQDCSEWNYKMKDAIREY